MGSVTLWKMDEKLKSENVQKEQFSEWGWVWGEGRCRERRYADHIFIQIAYTSECTIS